MPVRRVFSDEPLRPLGGAVQHDDLGGPRAAQVGRGERAHRPGADDDGPHARPGRGRARRVAAASASETTEAPAASMPVRACTRLPTRSACCDSSCSVRPDRARGVRGGVGGAQLAEDLRLADHHRVQPGGDGEQVLHGRARVVHVEVLGELGQRQPGVPAEHAGDVGEAAVEGVDDRVDLDAVAGRQHHHLGDVAAAQHLVEQLGDLVGRRRRRAPAARPGRCGATAPPRERS